MTSSACSMPPSVSSENTTPKPNVSSGALRSQTVTSLRGDSWRTSAARYRPPGPPPATAMRTWPPPGHLRPPASLAWSATGYDSKVGRGDRQDHHRPASGCCAVRRAAGAVRRAAGAVRRAAGAALRGAATRAGAAPGPSRPARCSLPWAAWRLVRLGALPGPGGTVHPAPGETVLPAPAAAGARAPGRGGPPGGAVVTVAGAAAAETAGEATVSQATPS